MPTSRWFVRLVLVLGCVLVSSAASGQVNLHPERLGTLCVSSVPDGCRERLAWPGPFQTFSVYVVADVDFTDLGDPAQNLSNGLSAWEARVDFPTELLVLGSVLRPETSLDVGSTNDNVYDFVVGTGTPVVLGGPTVLGELQWFIADATVFYTLFVRLGAVARPSVAGEAVWVEATPTNGCTVPDGRPTPCIFRFAELQDLRIGPEDAETHSFGSVKARFD